MIQFNLLPDVKLEYIKARRMKRSVSLVAGAVAVTSLGVAIMLIVVVFGFQREHMGNLEKDIARDIKKLESINDFDKVLTIQNQLNKLPALHQEKPSGSRLVTYMQQLTPAKASISSVNVDFLQSTMTLTGTADTLATVNQFVDTLKFTNYSVDGATEEVPAFSKVVLTSFGKSDKSASYSISLNFDKALFENTKQIALKIPAGKVTTRSQTEKPTALFQAGPNVIEGSGE